MRKRINPFKLLPNTSPGEKRDSRKGKQARDFAPLRALVTIGNPPALTFYKSVAGAEAFCTRQTSIPAQPRLSIGA